MHKSAEIQITSHKLTLLKTCSASFGMEIVFCRQYPPVWGFIFTVFLGLWSPQISAEVSIVPLPKSPAEGENVLLSVRGVTENILFFIWFRGQTPNNGILSYVPSSSTQTINNPAYVGRVRGFPNGSMELSGVTTRDSDSYTVQIQMQPGGQQQASVNITVYEILGKPSITANLPHPVAHRESVTLTCVTSSSAQTILWSKDSQSLPFNDRMSLSMNNRTLTISNVSSADSGNYRCEVINPASRSMSEPYNLTLYYGPNNVKTTPQASSAEQSNRTLQIAVGAAIGAVLGAVLLITAAVLLYKKYGNCQGIKNDDRVNVYEVPDMSGAPTHVYQNIILHNPGGPHVNTPNPKAPDSAYTDLRFGHQSVYDQLRR